MGGGAWDADTVRGLPATDMGRVNVPERGRGERAGEGGAGWEAGGIDMRTGDGAGTVTISNMTGDPGDSFVVVGLGSTATIVGSSMCCC